VGVLFSGKGLDGEARRGRIPAAVSNRGATKPAGLFPETPAGGGSFGRGQRWLNRHSPLRGCSGFAALATATIPRRRTPRNFQTGSREDQPEDDVLVFRRVHVRPQFIRCQPQLLFKADVRRAGVASWFAGHDQSGAVVELLRWSCAPRKSRQVAAQLRFALTRVAVSAASQSLASKPRLAVESFARFAWVLPLPMPSEYQNA